MIPDPEQWQAALLDLTASVCGRALVVSNGRLLPEDSREKNDRPAVASDRRSFERMTVCRGFPWLTEECSRRWIGDRLVCFPDGVPHGHRIAVVSSRLRRRLDLETWWFDLLRTLTIQCQPHNDILLVSSQTAGYEATRRAAALFSRRVICLDADHMSELSSAADLSGWLGRCMDRLRLQEDRPGESMVQSVYISPNYGRFDASDDRCGRSSSPLSSLESTPLPDRILFAAAQRIHVLSCRSGGLISQLIQEHLVDEERQSAPVLVAADSEGRLPSCSFAFPSGWVPWLVETSAEENSHAGSDPEDGADVRTRKLIAPITAEGHACRHPEHTDPLAIPDDWLLHWTRERVGPWPDETEEDFLDALILNNSTSGHSAFAALIRIVSAGRLIASSEGIRAGFSVVAFTAVPLAEFRSRRTFRRHRHRFDFEPWGVGIRKDVLWKLGARPVIYSSDEHWAAMPDELRPWFQKNSTNTATSNAEEQEWRIAGDVDLLGLPADAVCLFVENEKAAQILAQQSPWHVIVVP